MAEVTETKTPETVEKPDVSNPNPNEKTPSTEELMAQLAAERALREKDKAALDKALKEKGDLSKQLRQKMTTEEQEAEEKRAADEKRQAEYESAMEELNRMKASQAYTNTLTDEKTIETLIDAVNDKDHKSISKIIENAIKAGVKNAEAEWLRSRPQVASNGYSGMTMEQIMAIPDRAERRKAIAMNQNL